MNPNTIEPQMIRRWVYLALKKNGSKVEDVLRSVYNQACQEGFLQCSSNGHNSVQDMTFAIPPEVQNGVRGVIWDLIIQGIIVPGKPNEYLGSALSTFVVTDWGKKCLDDGEYLTFDAARYIARIREQIPEIDVAIVMYLKDALASFRVGAYLSSAVMAGVASECVLMLLRKAVEAALRTPERKKKFADATREKSANCIFREIWKRLDPNQEALCQHLGQNDIKVELSGIFDLIRKTRNDAGHPTRRAISRDEADSLLHLFPIYCKTVYATIEWLKSNPLP